MYKKIIYLTFLSCLAIVLTLATAGNNLVLAEISTAKDWIGLFPVDSNNGTSGLMSNNLIPQVLGFFDGSGTAPAKTLPSVPGAYEFRLVPSYSQNGASNPQGTMVFNDQVNDSGKDYLALSKSFWMPYTLTTTPSCSASGGAAAQLNLPAMSGVKNVYFYRSTNSAGANQVLAGSLAVAQPSGPLVFTDSDPNLKISTTYYYNSVAYAANNDSVQPNTLKGAPSNTISYEPVTTGANCNPIINQLTVSNGGNKTFTGRTGYSGLQSTDPQLSAGQRGSSWFNPMIIGVGATSPNPTDFPITQYFVAFYDKSLAPALVTSTLPIVTDSPDIANPNSTITSTFSSNPKAGFVLKINVNKTTQAKTYFVWGKDPMTNVWQWIDLQSKNTISAGFNGNDNSGINLYNITNGLSNPSPSSWTVSLYKQFGNKLMSTAVEVCENDSAFNCTTYANFPVTPIP